MADAGYACSKLFVNFCRFFYASGFVYFSSSPLNCVVLSFVYLFFLSILLVLPKPEKPASVSSFSLSIVQLDML